MKFPSAKEFIEWAIRLQKQGLTFRAKRSRARVRGWSSYIGGKYVHYTTDARGHGRFEPDNWRASLALFDTTGEEVGRDDMAEVQRLEWLREAVTGLPVRVAAGDPCPRCQRPLYTHEKTSGQGLIIICDRGHWFTPAEEVIA
jgi:hypothetical protein